ncbi:MAG: class I SAM-dependent rRNA methyltransferase [Paludisphaera borealis]|uniref:class I SAM-dependent rRNA methyltransferase n=1 Tax=Paludisphaera borealis TaxID=1387353 RepID=UPI0028490CA1|nr:class I SAM-dependent rRNA methyltransferase [Paludisphaera borealis]MDR3621808.1 class I SAM-dependent rRNA methyltransferase [Paludisphaera borealis]
MSNQPRPRARTAPLAAQTIPDRSLDPDVPLPVVAIRTPGMHPFIFRKMIDGVRGPLVANPGDLVQIVDRDGRPLGYGLWNPRSQISLRLLSRAPEAPGTEFWVRRIDEAVSLRLNTLGLEQETNAYRVVHAEGDGLSGLIVDRYDDVLSIEINSLGMYQRIGPILELFAGRLGTKHFRVHVAERVALQEDFSGRPLASPQLPPRITVSEHGIRYRIHFAEAHKTGFFCDQRDNRRDLAKFCNDRTVLDACCYTGGFGLNALIRGKAREVTCIDLDEKAVALAKENGNANSVRLDVVHADAFGYMRQMGQNERTYGVVVLDPPKLILDRDDVAPGKRKYFDLNVMGMKLVEPGGLLLTCSCSGLLDAPEFLSLLRAAARKANRSVQLLAMTGASADHPVALDAPESSYLKVAWLRIGERLPDEFFEPGV